jgi:hypothetical protein
MAGTRASIARRVGIRAAVVVVLLAACSGSTPDGWVSVGTGDTYGEWELFAEVRDGAWTGCLRFPDEDAPKACDDPGKDLVVFDDDVDGAQYGATGEDIELEFSDSRKAVETMDVDGVDDHRFFVVADTPIRVRR